MITTETYQENTELMTELLANFTALDQSVTAIMGKTGVKHHYKKLLNRLAILCSYHGPDVPLAFIDSVGNWTKEDYLQSVNAFLEIGKDFSDLSESEQMTVARRELQQEILHFSRIVDIASRQDEVDDEAFFVNKRLRNSRDIPVFMKVLTEIMTVVRSRHLNRGLNVPVPINRYRDVKYYRTDRALSLTFDQALTDFVLLLSSERQKLRRYLSYLYKNLLAYLTPLESGLAICIYLSEIQPKESVEILLLCPMDHQTASVLRWTYTPASMDDLQAELLQAQPRIYTVSTDQELYLAFESFSMEELMVTQPAPNHLILGMDEARKGQIIFKLVLDHHVEREHNFKAKSYSLVKRLTQERLQVLSIEAGHIHLDRDLDIDQEVGLEIGSYVYEALAANQQVPPRLTPMIDDDHVIVQLTPHEYDTFFIHGVGDNVNYYLIPESSPIIRAIVVALYERIRQSDASAALVLGGKNMYLEIDEFTTCEMFEDFNDRCDNGCAFFEIGLLLFRSDPELFIQYFNQRFHLDYDLHQWILDILSTEDTHDEKVCKIEMLYAQFAEVTNPHVPDASFGEFLDKFLSSRGTFTHLNVLEDYYEIQQHKVRAMIQFLSLPLHLISLHFNARSGRLVLNLGNDTGVEV